MATAAVPTPAADDPVAIYGKDAAAMIMKNLATVATDARQGSLRAMLDEMDTKLWDTVQKKAADYKRVYKDTDLKALERALNASLSNMAAQKMYNLGLYAIKNPTKAAATSAGAVSGMGFWGIDSISDAANLLLNPITQTKLALSVAKKTTQVTWDATKWGAQSAWSGVKWIGETIYKGMKFVWQKSLDMLKWMWDKFCDLQNASWHKALAVTVGTAVGAYFGNPALGAKAGEMGDKFGKTICGRGENPLIIPEGKDSPFMEWLNANPWLWYVLGGGAVLLIATGGDK